MTDLRHVWVRARNLQLVRADRVITLTLLGPHGRAESPQGLRPSGYNRICAEVEGGTDGDVITRVDLADADSPHAAGQPGQLASAITTAAATAQATECMFVYREGEGEAARWTSAPELPAWPAREGSGLSRIGD